MKTGKELFESGVVTNALKENVQQHGIDLRLKKVNKLVTGGVIPVEGKTALPDYEEVPVEEIKGGKYWKLAPGYYEIILEEGCKIPKDQYLFIVQRSSLMRCGGIIRSSIYDAGFETEHMGTFMDVKFPILIEEGARVAQAYTHDSNEVENLYNGQFQNDKQRK
jgi:deoxycytidine triphosphate deaminase